jgi:2-polyprenyl-6-methoxyphenol hydroxylase-like FAD-dependent oxidoreductase
VTRVLVCGAGIAGPTLAYWLTHFGFETTLVEKAPALRTGGYIIDFWGTGFEIAERMGLLPELQRAGYVVQEVKVLDGAGRRVAGFPASVFVPATNGRYLSLPRGELSAAIFRAIEGRVETIFGDSPSRLDETGAGVQVTFEHGAARNFDLVIGADGLHSRVRELVFGAESQYEKYLGIKAAAFAIDGYQPRDELTYVLITEVGRQIARFAMRDGRTMFLFTFADPNRENTLAPKALLRDRFASSGGECPRILDALDSAPDFYFDRVSQIRMNPQEGLWTRGRVTLIGDAASCISLLGGEGSGMAMIAAYILAGELHRAGGNYAEAFRRYQERFAPFVQAKQNTAARFAGTFAPKSALSLFFRNRIFNLLGIRWIANLTIGRFADNFPLPEYK